MKRDIAAVVLRVLGLIWAGSALRWLARMTMMDVGSGEPWVSVSTRAEWLGLAVMFATAGALLAGAPRIVGRLFPAESGAEMWREGRLASLGVAALVVGLWFAGQGLSALVEALTPVGSVVWRLARTGLRLREALATGFSGGMVGEVAPEATGLIYGLILLLVRRARRPPAGH